MARDETPDERRAWQIYQLNCMLASPNSSEDDKAWALSTLRRIEDAGPIEDAPAVENIQPGRRTVSKRMSRRTAALDRTRQQREEQKQQLGYLARPFILCGLPFRRPQEGTSVYKRTNGNEILEIHGSPEYGLPFGADIMALVWVSTLAVLAMPQNNGEIPRVITFRSIADFLKAFGLPLDGASYKRARGRFSRIFYATFFFGQRDSKRERLFRAYFFDSVELSSSGEDLHQGRLPGLESRIVLSESFAADLKRHHPPVEFSAVAAWKDKPAQLYFYLWLVFRCYVAKGRSKIWLMGPGSIFKTGHLCTPPTPARVQASFR